MTDNKLERMFEIQEHAQVNVYGDGTPLQDYDPERKIWFYTTQIVALEDELHEALNEMGWKPWATSRHFNTEAVQGELVDAFHFFMNLCIAAELTPELLFERYLKKQAKNMKRQQEGYDGITGKCPRCHRALDDDATTCKPETGFCSEDGLY